MLEIDSFIVIVRVFNSGVGRIAFCCRSVVFFVCGCHLSMQIARMWFFSTGKEDPDLPIQLWSRRVNKLTNFNLTQCRLPIKKNLTFAAVGIVTSIITRYLLIQFICRIDCHL